jgi:hypothetical protein
MDSFNMTGVWNAAQQLVHRLDDVAASLLKFDKIRVALFVTWLWAYAGLYVTKAFESFFRSILNMPDKWLAFPVGNVKNSAGQTIKILSAKTNSTDITNKLKIFMKLYWEKGSSTSANTHNGFDFGKLAKLLNCSMMYCCYLLTDANGNIQPEQFWNNINTFFVEQERNGECYKSTKVDLSDRTKLWLRNVSFEGPAPEEDSLDDLDDELSEFIRKSIEKPPSTVAKLISTFENQNK